MSQKAGRLRKSAAFPFFYTNEEKCSRIPAAIRYLFLQNYKDKDSG